MNETSKCRKFRQQQNHFQKYLHGTILDIGAGADPLIVESGAVRAWDKTDGDAMMLDGVTSESFDAVYSSHCLEHMIDVPTALANWTRVLRPGGFLYVVVPDYELYEKCVWPSMFNPEHKHTFSINLARDHAKRDNHWNLDEDLMPMLADLKIVIIESGLQFDGYDWNKGNADQTRGDALSQIYFVGRKLMH